MPAISASSVPAVRSGRGAFMSAVRTIADADLAANGESISTVAQILIGGHTWSTGRTYHETLPSNSGKLYGPSVVATYVHREILARVLRAHPTIHATAHNRGPVGFIVPRDVLDSEGTTNGHES